MAGASNSVYEFDSVVRGQHVYKSVWTPLTNWCNQICKCIPVREDDERDKRLTVATSEREMQTLREISRIS